jgi:hypothetical protein
MVFIANKGHIHYKNFTTRNHGFSKRFNLIKMSALTIRMPILNKGMGHESHMVLLVGFSMTIFDQVLNHTSNQEGQFF